MQLTQQHIETVLASIKANNLDASTTILNQKTERTYQIQHELGKIFAADDCGDDAIYEVYETQTATTLYADFNEHEQVLTHLIAVFPDRTLAEKFVQMCCV